MATPAVNIGDLLDYGKTFLGTPYKWGGSQPGGFDCSGFVQYVFGNMGVQLPRVSRDQAHTGVEISAADARPGDLVYWGNPAHHIAIYMGNGQMIAAPHTGDVVKVQAVYGKPGFRRVVTDNGAPSSGRYGGGGSLSGNGPVDPAAAIAQYGNIQMLAEMVPEIKTLLGRAVQEGWTADRFSAEFQASGYYRNTAEQRRKMDELKATQPGEYNRQRDVMIGNIWALGNSLGAKLDDEKVGRLTELAMNLGWSDAELRRALSNEVNISTGAFGGAATTVTSLKEQAAAYLVPMTDATLQQWTQQIAGGFQDIGSFKAYLIEQAKTLFPVLSSALDAGTTVTQFLQPYQTMAAQTLEVAGDAVSWNDQKYRAPVFKNDASGKQQVMNLTDYQRYLKELPEFRRTKQANESGATMVNALLQEFGKVAA